MARPLEVTIVIDRTPDRVWRDVGDISRHVEWMADAVEIRFTTGQREGVGTVFECDTRIGPLTTTDVMEVTSWEPGRKMGVRHTGAVEGSGEFTLVPVGDRRTTFRWREQLHFPWYFGSSLGAWLARPVLGWVWRRNLRRLKSLIED